MAAEKGNNTKKKIGIALQGGGAHGAFAWGVMDKLLEDGRFDIRGVSGTSAGGMNAASCIQGLLKGGEKEARNTLQTYWKSMSEFSKETSPFIKGRNPMDVKNGNFNLNHTLGFMMMGMLQSQMSPYEFNPNNMNPFREFVTKFFDFDLIRNNEDRKIFLGATHVRTGRVKVFRNADFSPDTLLASACLPFIFQAVKVKGEYYWDGGFIANPAIYPVIQETDANDIVLVQLTNTHCGNLPKTKDEVVNRFKEITYNGCLVREMRAIHYITKLIDEGIIPADKHKRVNMHVIKDEEAFEGLNLTSALNTEWEFLQFLFNKGRDAAHRWIEANYSKVGSKHSIDEDMFSDFMS